MIRMFKKTALLIIVVAMVVAHIPYGVSADETIDPKRAVSLDIHCKYEDEAIAGMTFKLYYVADILAPYQYELTEAFQNSNVSLEILDSDSWRTTTNTLITYVQANSNSIDPVDQGKTGENGVVSFPVRSATLKPGLYLVDANALVGQTHTVYAENFLISLPNQDQITGEWKYDLAVMAKCSKEENGNTYDTIDRRVLKVWAEDEEVIRPSEVVVRLTRNGEAYGESVTLNAENNWKHLWEDLPKYNDQGVKIEWSVMEEDVKDYSMTVSLEGITFKVTNTYDPKENNGDTVTKTVMKIWDDKGYENKRPSKVTIHLKANGKVYATQEITADMEWTYTWENLPVADDDGKKIEWTVDEDAVSGYTKDILPKGDYFLVTNAIAKTSLPQTGVLWWPVPVLAAAGLLFLILGSMLKGRKLDA